MIVQFNAVIRYVYQFNLFSFLSSNSISPQPQPSAKESPRSRLISKSMDSAISPESSPPPSPPIRNISSSIPPNIKPRISSRSYTSPVNHQQPQSSITANPPNKALPSSPNRSVNGSQYIEPPERRKRSSIDIVEDQHSSSPSPAVEYAEIRKHSVDLSASLISSQTQTISCSPSSVLSASSGPSSPNHTEDEKQENESNEKTDLFDEIITECK